jgi:hypothetical protein
MCNTSAWDSDLSLRLRSPLKGIMFWRWDAVAASVNYAVGDNALTLPSSSDEFQARGSFRLGPHVMHAPLWHAHHGMRT